MRESRIELMLARFVQVNRFMASAESTNHHNFDLYASIRPRQKLYVIARLFAQTTMANASAYDFSEDPVSEVVAAVERLRQTYSKQVPISLVRAGLANVPRALLDLALFEAEARALLRIEPVQLPAEFVEVGAGIPHERGLLYWIVPFIP